MNRDGVRFLDSVNGRVRAVAIKWLVRLWNSSIRTQHRLSFLSPAVGMLRARVSSGLT